MTISPANPIHLTNMKAITTKIIPATSHKPTRVKAQAEGVPAITISRGQLEDKLLQSGERVTEESIHQAAALALCERYQWGRDLASGGTHACDVWVHCFIPQEKSPVSVNDTLVKALQTIARSPLQGEPDPDDPARKQDWTSEGGEYAIHALHAAINTARAALDGGLPESPDIADLPGVRECTVCNDGSCAFCQEEIRQQITNLKA